MRVEAINTGTEILLGNVINTHLAYFGQQLFPLGLRVGWQTCVPDGPAIREALVEAFGRAEIVLVTGGLGPTSDDLTRDIAAELLGRSLEVDAGALAALEGYFARLERPLDDRIRRQALVPAGATVLPNAHGTAPGLYLPATGQTPHVFLLPGPPRELRPMFAQQVLPILNRLWPTEQERPGCRIYRTVGLGESAVEALVGPRLEAIAGLEIGYCARLGEVDVRCIGLAPALAAADDVVRPALGEHILAQPDDTLEIAVVRAMTARGQTLATAESCTGGLLASLVTDVPGASAVLRAGFVTYLEASKTALLGVDAGLIARCGAVSEPVAAAMAAGARRMAGADYALATTGFAGPTGGAEGRPVGTLFIALAGPEEEPVVERRFFQVDRGTFKVLAANAALDLLRRRLG